MNLPLCVWYAVGELAVPKLTAQESAAFLMLAASILVLRTFRERFLLVWVLAWSAYGVAQWFRRPSALVASPDRRRFHKPPSCWPSACLPPRFLSIPTPKNTFSPCS